MLLIIILLGAGVLSYWYFVEVKLNKKLRESEDVPKEIRKARRDLIRSRCK